jgi:hypothetical protein
MRFVRRAHAAAPAAEVWRQLSEPRRWPEFELFLQRVTGAPGAVRTGQRLLGVGRGIPLRIPIDVIDVQPGWLLSVVVSTAPGVSHRITVELMSAVRGGTDVRVTTEVDGVFAGLALLPSWATAELRLRRIARQAREDQPGPAGQHSGAA